MEAIARKFGAEVWLIFVPEVNEYYMEGEEPGVSVRNKVIDFKNEHFKNIADSQVVVIDGEPADEIISYVEIENIDLVVITTRGGQPWSRPFFGSVAANVARAASVPAILINP